MTSLNVTYARYELLRLWRNKRFFFFSLGFPIVLSKPFGTDTPSHQCGTARFGDDPAVSVLNTHCRSWDHENLFVIDASCFPSSAALNPALTVAAQALRASQHIEQNLRRF